MTTKRRLPTEEVYSDDYLHETACGLQDPDHRIRKSFVTVLEEAAARLEEEFDVETVVAAVGCGSCFHTDADVAFFWVAQNPAMDKVFIRYGFESPVPFDDLMDALSDTAEEHGVPISVPPSDSYSVVLGVTDNYVDLEPGTRVQSEARRQKKTGTVLSPDLVNSDMDWEVHDQSEHDKSFGVSGTIIGKFATKTAAEAFADEYDITTKVRSVMKYGSRPGDNVVMWDGREKATEVSTSDLTVIDDD